MFVPIPESIDQLLHKFFDIDPKQEEKERRALLDEIRKGHQK